MLEFAVMQSVHRMRVRRLSLTGWLLLSLCVCGMLSVVWSQSLRADVPSARPELTSQRSHTQAAQAAEPSQKVAASAKVGEDSAALPSNGKQNGELSSAAQDPKSGTEATEGEQTTPPKILVLEFEGGIFGGTADYLIENIRQAEAAGVPVLIKMDTPGGALEATRNIVKVMLNARVPILMWVGPSGARAGSAGVFLTMASHVASMAPGTNIGAAHPVGGGVGAPGDDEGTEGPDGSKGRRARNDQEVMAEKIENDTLAFVEAIANARGRNAEWARSAVKDSVSVTAEKALELKVIDLLAKDVASLLKDVEGRKVQTAAGPWILRLENAEQVPVRMTLRQQFLAFLSDPNLVYILMALGMLGLYLEFNHPGLLLPGAMGVIFLLLGLTGLSVLPYSATGLLFLALALGCFVAEIYVTSFGLLTIGGGLCLAIAGVLLFESPPELEGLPGLQVAVSPWVYGSIAIASVLVVLPIAYLVARAQLKPKATGKEAMLGMTGRALTDVSGVDGRVFVRGEYWEARSSAPIPAGAEIKVISVEGLRLQVQLSGASPTDARRD